MINVRAGLLSLFLLLELEGIYDENNYISALNSTEVLPPFPPSSHTICAPKSLQEKRLEPGLRSWPYFCLFAPFSMPAFSMPLPLMQASEINAVLLRNPSFFHLILILFHKCPLALRSQRGSIFISWKTKLHAGHGVAVIAFSVWAFHTYLDMRFY